MRLSEPRISPIPPQEWTDEQAAVLAPLAEDGRPVPHIFTTLAHHPQALQALLGWGFYVLSDRNSLPAREREILILRTSFLCGNGYIWTHHISFGQDAGLSEEEIAGLKVGVDAGVWSPAEAALIQAADDLVATFALRDQTWQALTGHFDQQQYMDAVFTIAEYVQLSMMLNSFGVQLEEGEKPDPDLPG